MKMTTCFFAAFWLLGMSCQRKLSASEVKDNLEKSMSGYLRTHNAYSARAKFEMLDVNYFEDRDFYECEFKVKLYRPDGSDTTGIIKGRISKDFSKVTKK